MPWLQMLTGTQTYKNQTGVVAPCDSIQNYIAGEYKQVIKNVYFTQILRYLIISQSHYFHGMKMNAPVTVKSKNTEYFGNICTL